jgi:Rtf2 RING-finger
VLAGKNTRSCKLDFVFLITRPLWFWQCNEPYTEDNAIPILPTKEADKQRLTRRHEKLAEQGVSHSLKKAAGSKKRKKHAEGDTSTAQTPAAQLPSTAVKIKNPATAMLTARVLEDEKMKRQRRSEPNENLQSLFTKGANGEQAKNGDFMTRGYTIPTTARR